MRQPAAEARPGAVDDEIGPCAQAFQIVEQRLVERRLSGDRKGGEGRPVQHRQGDQVLVAEFGDRLRLQPLQQALQPTPVVLAFTAEPRAFEFGLERLGPEGLRHSRSRRLRER